MKKGFLNTEKAKRKLTEADIGSPGASSERLGKKGKNKETPDDRTFTALVDGTIDLHRVPPHYFGDNKGAVKKRAIFLVWPRDPDGKPIKPSEIRGKQAGNGLDLWGATLYDFYHVRALPSVPGYIKISTGSKLANVMRSFGELNAAKDQLAWAEREESPKEIPAWDPAEAIDCYERRVHYGCFDDYSLRKKVDEAAAKSGPVAQELHESKNSEESSPEAREAGVDPDSTTSKSEAESGNTEHSGQEIDPNSSVSNSEADGGNAKQPEQIAPSYQPPVDSIFHPIHYPSPWPFEPFENPYLPFPLQRSVPLHLLPKKLHVHDPWNLLSVDSKETYPQEPWTSKEDIVHTYLLSLSSKSKEAADEASKAAAALEDAATEEIITLLPQQEAGEASEPAIAVVLPKRPRKLTEVPEAHLYISPKGALGEGHHSVVYRAEWELPRDLFCESTICRTCVEEEVADKIRKLKESGEWEGLLREAQKSDCAKQAGEAVEAPSAMEVDPSTAEKKVGEVIVEEKYIPGETLQFISRDDDYNDRHDTTNVQKPKSESAQGEGDPIATVDGVSESPNHADDHPVMDTTQDHVNPAKCNSDPGEMDVDAPGPSKMSGEDDVEGSDTGNMDTDGADASSPPGSPPVRHATLKHPRVVRITSYKGAVVQISVDLPWQNPSFPDTICEHRSFTHKPVPRTAVFQVAAKLSKEHDQHLAREANNYLEFPAHFFQHWNGYNVIPPLHNPVPLGAVVPQFYGYYVPEEKSSGYRSPILLIEHCGEPVEPKKLCEDDREECAALLFRFHYAGWLHESFAARNIVVQPGLPTAYPLERTMKPTPSFRLIDFGRSREYQNSGERAVEEQEALSLFYLHHFHRPSPS